MTVDAERRSQIVVDVEGGWRELKETGADLSYVSYVSSKKVFACNHMHRDETSSTMSCTSMSLSLAAPRPIQSNDKQRHTLFCVEPFELLSHTQPCGKPHAHT